MVMTLNELKQDLAQARAEQQVMRDHPFAVHCGEDDAVADRIELIEAEIAALDPNRKEQS
jgi:hypothetical protein